MGEAGAAPHAGVMGTEASAYMKNSQKSVPQCMYYVKSLSTDFENLCRGQQTRHQPRRSWALRLCSSVGAFAGRCRSPHCAWQLSEKPAALSQRRPLARLHQRPCDHLGSHERTIGRSCNDHLPPTTAGSSDEALPCADGYGPYPDS